MKKRYYIIILIALLATKGFSQAPDFTITSTNGTDYTLYDQITEGKAVILDFFSVSCVYCQVNTPKLDSIYRDRFNSGEYGWVWGIETSYATDSAIDQFMIDYGGSFPGFSVIEDDSIINAEYGYEVPYTPYYYVITPDTRRHQVPYDEINDVLDEYGIALSSENHVISDLEVYTSDNRLHFQNLPQSLKANHLQVIDITGKILINKKINHKSGVIDLPSNINGLCFVRILQGNRPVFNQKLILR